MSNRATNTASDTAVAALTDTLKVGKTLCASDGVDFAQRAQREFAALEATHLAAMKAQGATDNAIRRKTGANGTRTRKQTSTIAKRANAVNENPQLVEKLASGDLSEEHIDALANASQETGGQAANDTELIKELEDSKPDDAAKVTRKWLERQEQDAAQTRYDRQNQRRSATTGHDPITGCDTFTLKGPTEKIRQLKKRATTRANEMYQADGGRDLPKDQHRRSLRSLTEFFAQGLRTSRLRYERPAKTNN